MVLGGSWELVTTLITLLTGPLILFGLQAEL